MWFQWDCCCSYCGKIAVSWWVLPILHWYQRPSLLVQILPSVMLMSIVFSCFNNRLCFLSYLILLTNFESVSCALPTLLSKCVSVKWSSKFTSLTISILSYSLKLSTALLYDFAPATLLKVVLIFSMCSFASVTYSPFASLISECSTATILVLPLVVYRV